MIRRLASRIGASYAWGLANFTAGVILASAYVGILVGLGVLPPHHHEGETQWLSGQGSSALLTEIRQWLTHDRVQSAASPRSKK